MKSRKSMLVLMVGMVTWLLTTQTGWSYYNPSAGRWLSRDPLGERGGPNLYGFVHNGAVSSWDPMGMASVSGLDITTKFCFCQAELKREEDWAKKMQQEYKQCGEAKDASGNPTYRTSQEIQQCVLNSLQAQGIGVTVAGTTDSSGNTSVQKQQGKCGPILERATQIHEDVHARDVKDAMQAYGSMYRDFIGSADFTWNTEFNAYGAEVPFYEGVLNELNKLRWRCCWDFPAPSPVRRGSI